MSKSFPVLASLCLTLGLLLVPTAVVAGGVAGVAAPTAGTTAERAASTAIDDRDLVRSTGWRSVREAQAYRKTLSKATKKGSTATTRMSAASGASVTFEFGPRRGKAQVLVGGKVRSTVSTASAKVRLVVVRVSGAGKVKVRVATGRNGVFLDKVVLGLETSASPFATGSISRVDASAAGAGGNGHSVSSAAVSPDGLYVAFWSDATNLSPEATDGLMHLYVKTLATGAVRVADKSESGVLGNDGGYVGEARVIGWRPVGHQLLFTTYADNLLDGTTFNSSYAPFLMAKDLDDNSVGFIAAAVHDAAWSPDDAWIAFSSKYVDGCISNPCPGNVNYSSQLFAWQVGTANYVPVSADAAGTLPSDGTGPLEPGPLPGVRTRHASPSRLRPTSWCRATRTPTRTSSSRTS